MKTWKEIKLVTESEQSIYINPDPNMKKVECSFSMDPKESLILSKEDIVAWKNSLDEMIKHLEL